MFLYQTPPARRQLVGPVQPPDRVDNDREKHSGSRRGFRRFFLALAPDKGNRAADMDARTTWSQLLAARRLIIQAELADIAQWPCNSAVPDYGLRVERISMAMYLLGRLGGIVRKEPVFVQSDLWPALLHAVKLLEKPYFREPVGLVLSNYDQIRAQLEEKGFSLLGANEAAKKYKHHIEGRIGQMRRRREERPKEIDVMA